MYSDWYIINIIIILFTFLLHKKDLITAWVLLMFFAGFRYNIGSDYLEYEFIHNYIIGNSSFFASNKEVFHICLTKFVNYFGGNFQSVVLIYSLLTFYFLYKGFRYYSADQQFLFLVTIIFFTTMYYSLFNGLRQDLSVGIFIYSTKYILEKNKIKYILLIIFAILVHKSAIILLPLYWVINIRFNNFIVILILIISVILIYIDITSYIKLALTNFNLPYVAYISGNKFSSSPNMYIKFVTIISMLGAIGLFILNRNNPKENIVFNLFLFGMILKALTLHMLVLGRLSYYIKPFIILYIVYIIFNVIKSQKSRKISLILFSLVFYIFSLIQLNSISKVLDAYTQYSLNFNLAGKANPIQVFGNYKNVTVGQ